MAGQTTLPHPGYDQLTTETLIHRIRSLTSAQVEELLAHERAHGDRAAVKEILVSWLVQLAAGHTPSPGGAALSVPGGAPGGGSPVSPATAAPPSSPPPHGVPAQPARPKSNHQ
jgi:hypothetical protein